MAQIRRERGEQQGKIKEESETRKGLNRAKQVRRKAVSNEGRLSRKRRQRNNSNERQYGKEIENRGKQQSLGGWSNIN